VLKQALRLAGFLSGSLVVLVVLAGGGVYLNAQRLVRQRHTNPVQDITVERSPEAIARGRYLVSALPGCVGCHSSNPGAEQPVLDGHPFTEVTALVSVVAPNLTPGGPLQNWTDGEIVRAIREGVAKDGHALLLMPSDEYRLLPDEDVRSIVAYLRSSEPVITHDASPRSMTMLGTMLVGAGLFSLSDQPSVPEVTAPPRGPTAEYGAHLADTASCRVCHGPALDAENVRPGPPPGPNLRVVKGWTEQQFIRAMREGIDPSGKRLSDAMPWRQYGRGTDDDLRALYQYLKSLP
jgi:mono/diheme cytochrome c family protein